MKKNLSKLIFLLLLSLFVYGCRNNNIEYSDLFLTDDNNGQTVEIGIDNKIVIKLKSNPSTGYKWVHSNTDESFIYQDGKSIFKEDPECSGLCGCGGVETLTFRSSQTGYGVISLMYCRSSKDEPARYFTVYVKVH